MTSKSSSHSASYVSGIEYRDKITNALVVGGFSPATLKWTDTVTYGESLPDWRQALREGSDATTSLSGSRSEVTLKSASLKYENLVGSNSFYILIGGFYYLTVAIPGGNPATLDATNTDAFALSKFAQKVYNAQTALQGGVVLGELRQTLQMLRNPAQGLRRLVDDQRGILMRIRAQRRLGSIILHKRKIAENLADAWLELQFGWRPFLSDVDGALKALDVYTTGQSVLTRRITAMHETYVEGTEAVEYQGESFAYMVVHSRVDNRIIVVHRGAMRVEAQHPGSMDPKLIGFSPKDFLPTAWELIPYSFLADYFTNIGGIIYGMSNLFTSLAWHNRTTIKKYTFRMWGTEYPYAPNTMRITGAYGKVVTSKTSVERAKYVGHGVPPLAFKIPGFGSLKWLNIAALVASRKSDRNWSFD
jgi:hypothetical protein